MTFDEHSVRCYVTLLPTIPLPVGVHALFPLPFDSRIHVYTVTLR